MKKIFVFFIALFVTLICNSQPGSKVRINHTAIYVTDVRASAYFYQNIIGFDTISEPFHDGLHVWFKTGTGIALHIIQGAEVKKEYY